MKDKVGIWKSIRKYKLNSVFVKNFVFILLLIMLPLSVITLFIYRYFNEITEEEIKNMHQASLIKVKDTTDMIINECNTISLRIITDNNTLLYMLSSETLSNEVVYPNPVDFLNYLIKTFTLTSDYIDSIYMYSENKDYVISNHGSASLSSFYDNSWHKSYLGNKGERISWMETRSTRTSPFSKLYYYLSLYRVYEEGAGAAIINIDLKKLGDIIDINENHENIYILDREKRIIYNSDVSLIGSPFNENMFPDGQLADGQNGSVVFSDNGTKRILSIVHSDINDWSYVSYMSLESYEEKIKNLSNFVTVFILICVIIAVIVSILISIKVFGPIRDIIAAVERPEDWLQFKTDKTSVKYDEVRFIADNIIDSYHNVHELKSNLEKRITLLKKAQTVALQSQINPHFLYNTLETINWMAMELTKSKNKVSEMILSLSKLLRLSLDSENSLIPLALETDHAKMYLDIQKYRYGEKFDVIWELDNEILKYKIVKITIQPLIENAIYHGIKPSEGKGLIRIRGYFYEEGIVIEVNDNGVGMEAHSVAKLNMELQNEFMIFDNHIGLKNVNQRIKLIMGDKYGLTVYGSREGTTVRMFIPRKG